MNKQNLGIGLLKIGSFLYATRYVVAALLMGSAHNGFDGSTFEAAYRTAGGELTFFAVVSVLGGVAILTFRYVRDNVRKLQAWSEK